jgi:hypothetical protein
MFQVPFPPLAALAPLLLRPTDGLVLPSSCIVREDWTGQHRRWSGPPESSSLRFASHCIHRRRVAQFVAQPVLPQGPVYDHTTTGQPDEIRSLRGAFTGGFWVCATTTDKSSTHCGGGCCVGRPADVVTQPSPRSAKLACPRRRLPVEVSSYPNPKSTYFIRNSS